MEAVDRPEKTNRRPGTSSASNPLHILCFFSLIRALCYAAPLKSSTISCSDFLVVVDYCMMLRLIHQKIENDSSRRSVPHEWVVGSVPDTILAGLIDTIVFTVESFPHD